MKILVFVSIVATCNAVGPFVPFPYEPFGVYKERRAHELEDAKKVVSTSKKEAPEVKKVPVTSELTDDYELAEDALFHAIEDAEKKVLKAANRAEQAIEHAIHDEVDTMFHGLPHHEKVAADVVDKKVKKAKNIVKEGEKTVKKVGRCWPENLKESLEECLAGDIE